MKYPTKNHNSLTLSLKSLFKLALIRTAKKKIILSLRYYGTRENCLMRVSERSFFQQVLRYYFSIFFLEAHCIVIFDKVRPKGGV
jgi:hypothetical protein